MDVTGVDECIRTAVLVGPVVDCGIECVREAVGEHPCEPWIGQKSLDFDNLVFDGFRPEEPVLLGRSLRYIFLGMYGRADYSHG